MKKKILYQEISDAIKKDIISGKYPLDKNIPSETEFEAIYNVSRITIRKAIQILCNDGYVIKQSGKGTKVISNRPFNILSKATSFTTILEREGKKVDKTILSIKQTDNLTNRDFKYPKVIEISRLYRIDDKPVIYFKHHISVPNDYDIKELNKQNFSLYSFMKNQSTDISYIDDQFSAIEVNEEVKDILELKVSYALKRIRKSYDNNNKLVEYSVGFYDSEKQPYIVDYEV